MQNKNQSVKNCIIAFAAATLVLLLGCAALTAYVDPFFHFHAPLMDFPYVVENELSQNPGMAENMEYDAIITGSSMTLNFDTKDFIPMGLNVLKLCTNGALPRDISNVLEIVFDKTTRARKTAPVKAAFIAVDGYTYTADTDATKYDQPYWLYNGIGVDDIRYLLNKDVILEYILRPAAEKQPTDLSTVYATTWADDFYYRKEWVLQNYTAPDPVETVTPEDAYIERTKANLETNILPYIEANPDTTFYMFYPPYSVLYWYNVMQENHMEATKRQYEYIGERLLEYDNVRVFFFQNEEEIITDLNMYMDLDHYRPEINKYMVECFINGKDEVRSGGMKPELDKTERIIKNFDYAALFNSKEEE